MTKYTRPSDTTPSQMESPSPPVNRNSAAPARRSAYKSRSEPAGRIRGRGVSTIGLGCSLVSRGSSIRRYEGVPPSARPRDACAAAGSSI